MKNNNHSKEVLRAMLFALTTLAIVPVVSGQTQSIPPMSESKKLDARLAVTTLSKQLSINPAGITVIHVSIMDWPDSSLGCPKPGNQYLQMITRGSLVLLRANMKAYRVHIGNNRAIVCDKPNKNILPFGKKTTVGSSMQNLMQQARNDLADRLGVSISRINTVKIESQSWPNSALGCAANGLDYQPDEIRGFRITMEYKGREFSYHTDQHRTIPCPAIERE